MASLLNDLRIAVRSLGKNPGFTAAAVMTLALGIAATTTLFSVVYGVLLRPLPYAEPDRVVQLFQLGESSAKGNLSGPNFEDLAERSRSFQALARISMTGTVSVLGGNEAARASQVRVSREYFDVLGILPQHGRFFAGEELVAGGAPAVVVSDDFWRRSLGGRQDLAGTTLTFGGRVHPVVGVLPPGLGYPAEPALITAYETDAAEESRTAHNWRAVGRLAGGVTVEAAQRELSAIAAELKRTHGDDTWMSDAAVVPLRDEIVGAVRPALLVLLGAAAFLFLIAGANVASLLLTRAAGRQRELAVRRALGASRRRILQGALAESLLLSLTACAVGVVLALWAVDLLRALAPATLPRTSDIRVDSLVLSVALAGSLLTAGGLGMAIGARAMRGGLREALSERRGGGSGAGRARALLVSGQMALTVVLLVGAMLLGRSFLRLLAVDPGYRTSGATVLSLALDWPESPADASRQLLFHDELIARLGALPGVTSVGGVNSLPLGHGFSGSFLLLERLDEVASFDDFQALSAIPSRVGYADYRVATGGYFPAMGIRLLRGRLFDERDHVEAPHVAVVSESLARSTWPGQDPLGRLIQFGNMDGDLRAFTVVGVVSDVRQGGLEGEVGAIVYGSARQRIGPAANLEVVIHGPSDPRTVIPAARQIMRELAPDIPLRLLTLEELFARSIAQRRFSLLLFALFGGTALLLAMIGLYGVVSYSIVQRTHEIGVRIALGAQSADVTGLVIRQGAVLAGAGILAGLLAALALSRLVAGLLFGVTATDPLAFAAVALLLAAVALLASYLPARRATRVDPIQALRAE